MNNSFFAYLEQLEIMIFFSGYPLVYLLIRSFTETSWAKNKLNIDITSLLPVAYALIGILYLGLQLKNLYPDFDFQHFSSDAKIVILKIWGLLSILFFLPFFSAKPIFSLLHSLAFFILFVIDMLLFIFNGPDWSFLKNSMNIYTYSLIINSSSLVFVILAFLLFKKISGKIPGVK